MTSDISPANPGQEGSPEVFHDSESTADNNAQLHGLDQKTD